MPYLGNIPATQFAELKYQDFTGGTGTSFTLNDPVGSAQELEVFVNNVRQEPGVAYTVSGTALTMTGSIVASDDFYVVFQGKSIPSGQIPEKQSNGDYTFDDGTLFVDASADSIGIGTTSPSELVHIKGASGAATDVQIQGGDDTNSVRLFMGGDTNRLHGRIVYSTASDFMAFSTGGDQRIRVDSDGLKFGSDTAAANALDDYEEGEFDVDVSTSNLTVNTSQDRCRYTKIGRMVYVTGTIKFTSVTSSSDTVTITGLPFSTAANVSGGEAYGHFTILLNNIDGGNAGNLALTGFGTTAASIYKQPESGGFDTLRTSDFSSSGTEIYFSGWYTAA